MSVTGTPATPTVITTDQVRMFLRDRAENNILLADVQFSLDELNLALSMAVSKFNAVTPQSTFTPQSFPSHLQYVLMVGTCAFLMQSESFLQLRNQATYQDGDIAPIGVSDKVVQYQQLQASLKQEFDELVRGIKTQNNMEGAYAVLGSGYRNVARYNHS